MRSPNSLSKQEARRLTKRRMRTKMSISMIGMESVAKGRGSKIRKKTRRMMRDQAVVS